MNITVNAGGALNARRIGAFIGGDAAASPQQPVLLAPVRALAWFPPAQALFLVDSGGGRILAVTLTAVAPSTTDVLGAVSGLALHIPSQSVLLTVPAGAAALGFASVLLRVPLNASADYAVSTAGVGVLAVLNAAAAVAADNATGAVYMSDVLPAGAQAGRVVKLTCSQPPAPMPTVTPHGYANAAADALVNAGTLAERNGGGDAVRHAVSEGALRGRKPALLRRRCGGAAAGQLPAETVWGNATAASDLFGPGDPAGLAVSPDGDVVYAVLSPKNVVVALHLTAAHGSLPVTGIGHGRCWQRAS
jgi:hypothetical protein